LTNKKQRFYTAKSCSIAGRESEPLFFDHLKSVKWLCAVFVLVLFTVAPTCGFAIEAGETAPDFKLQSLAGEDVSLSDFKGRLVLLKLATTWCPTCKQLSAEIGAVGPFLKEENVVVLEVFVQDSKEMIVDYLGDHEPPMTFHALLDDGQAYEAYSVYLIPRFLVVDKDQVVRFDSSGRNVMADDIRTLVKEYNDPQS
jgi:peroxiredoxin